MLATASQITIRCPTASPYLNFGSPIVLLFPQFRSSRMPTVELMLNPMRTAKQGVQVNIGKESEEYKKLTTTLSVHPSDMDSLGVANGDSVMVRTEFGEAEFTCETGKVPQGLIFVPYGPPTCRLMGGDTDGTGMPTSKGWLVDVQPLSELKR